MTASELAGGFDSLKLMPTSFRTLDRQQATTRQ